MTKAATKAAKTELPDTKDIKDELEAIIADRPFFGAILVVLAGDSPQDPNTQILALGAGQSNYDEVAMCLLARRIARGMMEDQFEVERVDIQSLRDDVVKTSGEDAISVKLIDAMLGRMK